MTTVRGGGVPFRIRREGERPIRPAIVLPTVSVELATAIASTSAVDLTSENFLQYPPEHFAGLASLYNTVSTVDVGAGSTRDSADAGNIDTAVTLTADITASGAGGLDTGTEAASTWYAKWLIGKTDGTAAAMLSLSFTAPTMPTGYTLKRRVGAVYNNGSSNFEKFLQTGKGRDREIWWDDFNNHVALNSVAGQTAYAAKSLVAHAPPSARQVWGYLSIQPNAAANSVSVRPTGATDATAICSGSVGAVFQNIGPQLLTTNASQSVDWKSTSISDTIFLAIFGYRDEL